MKNTNRTEINEFLSFEKPYTSGKIKVKVFNHDEDEALKAYEVE